MSEQENVTADETVAAEQETAPGKLVAFLAALENVAPAIPAVVNAALDAISRRNVAAAGRAAASGDEAKAIENLVRNAATSDDEHNKRAERILDLESELANLIESQKVSAAPLVKSLSENVVDDATFTLLDSTAKGLRANAVKMIESSAAAVPGSDVKELVAEIPTLTGGRASSGGTSAGSGTWRPYGRIFFVDGKKVAPLKENGKPNLAAAVAALQKAGVENVTADSLRNALGEKYGTESKTWADSQKSDALEFHGHTVHTIVDPDAGNKGKAVTAGDK